MEWTPVPPIEAYAEALSVPAMVHAPEKHPFVVIALGNYALPVVKLALRYPSTTTIYAQMDEKLLPRDKRVVHIERLNDIPKGTKAGLIAVAMPGDPAALVVSLRSHTAPDTITVVSFDTPLRGKQALQRIKPLWPHITPYRAHVPESALFFLLSDRKIGRPVRNFPPKLKKLTPGYMNSLFVLAKDERRLLYGDAACDQA